LTNAVVASALELSETTGVGPVGVPVRAGDALGAPPAPVTSPVVKVTAPFLPLKVATPAAAAIAAPTNCVVAIWVVAVPAVAVGAVGVPASAGEGFASPPTPVTSAAVRVTAPVRVFQLVTPLVALPPETKLTSPLNVARATPVAGSKS